MIIRTLFAAILLWCAGRPAVSAESSETAFTRQFAWHEAASGREARGLFAFESTDRGAVHRLFIQYSPRDRVVLSVLLDPLRGLWRESIIDDLTGIAVSVDVDQGIAASTLSEFFERSHDLTGDKVTAVIGRAWRGNAAAVLSIPVMPDGRRDCREAAKQISEETRRALMKGLPSAFARLVAFLDAALGPTTEGVPAAGVEFRCVVELTAELTRGGERKSTGQWQQTVEEIQAGAELRLSEDQAFLAKFRTARDKARPLFGHRVTDELQKSR